MLNSEWAEQHFPDKAMRNIHGFLRKKRPGELKEYERHLQEIKDRQVAFWKERESERIEDDSNGKGL